VRRFLTLYFSTQTCPSFIKAFKLFGYSWDIPRSAELIGRMETCLELLSPNSTLAQLFPFYNNWTGMCGVDQDLAAYDNDPTLGFL
jgi:hypothetical protein